MAKKILCAIMLVFTIVCMLAACENDDYHDETNLNGETSSSTEEDTKNTFEGNINNEIPNIPKDDTNSDETMDNEDVISHTHFGGSSSCLDKAICELCGQKYGDYATHYFINGVCEYCSRYEGAGLIYTKDDSGLFYSVSGIGTCTDSEIIIPSIYQDLPVTKIADSAFEKCKTLKSIVIPNSVTHIGKFAFWQCSSLEKVIIPESVTTVDKYAFWACTSLKSIVLPNSLTTISDGMFYACVNLTNVKLGNNVISIDYSAFDNTKLESIDLPDSLICIGKMAFSDCALTYITIPDGVTTIGEMAFYICDNLLEITVPQSVTYIGDSALRGCSSLKNVVVSEDNTNYKSIDGNLYDRNVETLIFYAIGKTDTCFTIPSTVKNIYEYSFLSAKNLTSVDIPDSVINIGLGAFGNCLNLKSLIIPESVTSIDKYVFSNCTNLTIYCEVVSKPSGWSTNWNSANCTVVWGYTNK